MVATKKKTASVPIVELYNVDESARYLGVHSRTIIREINRGKIEAYLIGKGFKVKRSELDRYLEKHKVKPQAA